VRHLGRRVLHRLPQHPHLRLEALRAEAAGEAREDRDLLLEPRAAHEGAAAALAHEVAFLDEVEDRLAHRREADPELLGESTLALQPRAGREPAALDAVEQQVADLHVQRKRRAAADRRLPHVLGHAPTIKL
jgi:hypothetical protein